MGIFKERAIGRFIHKLLADTKSIKVSLVVDNDDAQQFVHIDTEKLVEAINIRDTAEIIIEIGDERIVVPVKP